MILVTSINKLYVPITYIGAMFFEYNKEKNCLVILGKYNFNSRVICLCCIQGCNNREVQEFFDNHIYNGKDKKIVNEGKLMNDVQFLIFLSNAFMKIGDPDLAGFSKKHLNRVGLIKELVLMHCLKVFKEVGNKLSERDKVAILNVTHGIVMSLFGLFNDKFLVQKKCLLKIKQQIGNSSPTADVKNIDSADYGTSPIDDDNVVVDRGDVSYILGQLGFYDKVRKGNNRYDEEPNEMSTNNFAGIDNDEYFVDLVIVVPF